MPDPIGIIIKIGAEDLASEPIDKSSAALQNYALNVQAAADISDQAAEQFKAFGQALLTPLISSIAGFQKFQAEMFGVQKITGDTDAATSHLAASLIELSQNSTLSADKLASVAGIAAQLGIRGTEALSQFTETVSRMALVTDLTADHAAKAFARINQLFSLTSDQVERLGAAINELENRTTATASELVSIVQRLGPLSATIGLNVKQALGFAATLRDVGITSEEAGTNLSTVFQRMGAMIPRFAKLAGVSAKLFKEQFMEEPTEALFLLLQGIRNLADKSTPDALVAIRGLALGGARSSKILLALANSVDKLRNNISIANDAFDDGGSLQREFGTQTRGLGAQLDIFMNRVHAIGLAIGSVLVPPLTLVVQLFSFLTRIVGLIPAPILAAVAVIAALAGVFLLLVGASIAAGAAFIRFVNVMDRMRSGLGLTEGFESLAESIGLVRATFSTLMLSIGRAKLPAQLEPIRKMAVATMQWFESNVLLQPSLSAIVRNLWAQGKALAAQLPAYAALIAVRIKNAAVAAYDFVMTSLSTGATIRATAAISGWVAATSAQAAARSMDAYMAARSVVIEQVAAAVAVARAGQIKERIGLELMQAQANMISIASSAKSIAASHASVVASQFQISADGEQVLALAGKIVATDAASVSNFGLAVSSEAATGATWSLNAAIASNPIGALLVIVLAFTVGMTYLITKINEGSKAAQAFGVFIAIALAPLLGILSPIILLLVAYQNNFLGIKNAIMLMARAFGYVFGAIYAVVMEALRPLIDLWNKSSKAMDKFWTSLGFGGSMAEEIFDTFKYLVSVVLTPMSNVLSNLVGEIRALLIEFGILGGESNLVLDVMKTIASVMMKSLLVGVRIFAGVLGFVFAVIAQGAYTAFKAIEGLAAPFLYVMRAAMALKRSLFGSSLLHIGEGAQEAAKMIANSLPAALEEIAHPQITPILHPPKYQAPVSSIDLATQRAISSANFTAPSATNSQGEAKATSVRGGGGTTSPGKRSIEITVPISLMLDGRVLAEVVQKVMCEDDLLSYGDMKFAPGVS